MFGSTGGLGMVKEDSVKKSIGYLPSFMYELYCGGNIDRKIKYTSPELLESIIPLVQDAETKIKMYKEIRRSTTERIHSNSLIVREITGIIDFIEVMANAGKLTWKMFKIKRGVE